MENCSAMKMRLDCATQDHRYQLPMMIAQKSMIVIVCIVCGFYFWCCFQHFFLCQPSYDSIETVIIDFLIVRSHYYSTERCFWWRCNYQVSNYCLYNSFYSIVSHNSLLGRYYIAFTTNLIFIWISHSTFSSSHFFPILL